jgi:uncharacterized protein YuzE
MNTRFLPDTDTLLLTFSDRRITQTHDLGENVLIKLGDEGRLVSMTIEHAKQQMNVAEFSYHLAAR